MKSKKLLSVIVVLAMILQMLPVFATQTVAEDTVTAINYFVNDQFNTDGDTEGWVKGAVKTGTAAFTVTQGEAPDGSGALILHTEGGSSGAAGNQPNAYKAFTEKIDFEGKTVVIKTRFMQAGDGAETSVGAGYLKFNQPNNIAFASVDDIKWNWTNTWNRTDAVPSMNGANKLCRWFELFEFDTTKLGYIAQYDQANWRSSTYSAENTVNKWIEAEITINGSEDITISATIDGVKGDTVNGTLKQSLTGPYIAYTLNENNQATEWISAFTTLDSLTWEATTKNDIYVDYIQVYEPANVDIEAKKTIKEDGVFTFEVINSNDTVINSLPEGAVTIEGVETEASYDAETGTLTLTPETALTGGTTYTAVVDAAKLEEAGIIYKGETTFDIKVEIKLPDGFYLDDQFNTSGDTQGWVKGAVKTGTAAFTVTQGEAPDGSGALIFTSEGAQGGDGGKEPNIFKELTDKIPLNEGKKIVIKTRFMQAGDDAAAPTTGTSYLRFNQPNNENLLSNSNISSSSYPAMTTKINNANSVCDWFTLLKMEKGALSYRTQNGGAWAPTSFATVDTLGKWIDATITINSNTSVEVSATIDGATYSKTDGSLIYSGTGPLVSYTLYNDPTATTALTQYPSLDSLTWVSHTKNTVYVDYIQVFEPQKPKTYEAQVVMPQGSTIEVGKDFEVKFVNVVNENAEAATLTEIPDGAVTVENVATTNTFDALTQTLTLTPDSLTEGNIYKVVIDSEKLAEANIIYKGTTEFSVTARGARSSGFVLNDNFADGFDGWEVGPAADGFTTTTEIVKDDGAKDGKALKITFPARSGSSASNYGTVTKAVGNGIEFKDGKTITFETRVKKTELATDYNIRVNRPNTEAQIFGDYDYIHYVLLKHNGGSQAFNDPSVPSGIIYGGTGVATSVSGDYVSADPNWYTRLVDYTNKWVTYKFVFTPSAGAYTVGITYTDDNGEENTRTLSGKMVVAKSAIDQEYGKGYFDASAPQYFKALERLAFSSVTGGDVYVDYVKVYESASAKAQLLNGKRIETNDSFRLQFMAEREIDEIPAGAVTVTGAEVNSTFDAETQTLTLTPNDALTAGNEYTVTIDKTKLADKAVAYEGTTEFKVEAIAPRTTNLGTIVNTNFDDATLGGWVQGVANDGYKATLTPVTDGDNKVLEIAMPKTGNDATGGNQAIAHFELPEGIKYEEGKVVVIKARVKNVTNTPYMIYINRRDTLTQPAYILQHNCYGLAGQMVESSLNKLVFSTSSVQNVTGGQWRAMLPFNHDGNKESFSFANVDLANKWVEWEIVLDGNTNKMNVKATVEGLDKVLTTWSTQNPVSALNPMQVLEYEYGKGTDIKTFGGLDSISFANTSAEGTLYIDYVTVENKKDTAKVTSALTVNGVTVNKFNIGDTVVPQFTVNPAISDKYTAISVMYVDGVIDTMYMEEIESENTCATTITSENSFTVPAKGDVVIKTFVWDKFETMKPLGGAATATLNDSIEVYVASNGDDINGTGDITSPVATLEKAIDIASDKVSAISGFDGRVEVIVDKGTYSPVTVSKSDIKVPAGGLVITNAEDAKPVISGGVDISIAEATKVEDATILNRISSQDAKNNLYVLDLAGIDVPAESWPGVKSFGVEALAEAADGITIPEDSYIVSFNGQLMTNARWPNTGYEKALTVGGNKDSATSENVKDGFILGCSNTNDWTNAKDALIFGFFGNGWATQTTPLAGKSGNTITSAYASRYGASETHAKYYVYNLLEEIDTPYEYYIDRSVTPNKMYFYKPSNVTEGNITFATEKNILLTLSDVSNVTVDGLIFENTIGRAVSISRGSNNTIKNCEIRNAFADIDSETDNAVLDVFSKNTVVENNYIHNTNGGIKVGSDTPDEDSKTLASANNIIRNNEIENYGISDKTYVDAVYCMGIGNQILNNEIHNAEHLAMRISGINHNIQYNEIYDVCKETEDVGAIYMGHTWTSRGNKIVNNYFHDINTTVDTSEIGVNPIAAIFLDDHFAGAYIEGNIFANIGGDGVRSNRGREGYINNNLFVNCTRYGVALWAADTADTATTAGNYSGWLTSVKNIQEKVEDGTFDATVWRKAFPELLDTKDEDWVKPEKFTVTNNIAVNGAKCLSVGNWITTLATKIEKNEVTANDPGFKDMNNGDYTIDLSLLQAIVPQFKDIQFVNMGRK